MFSAALLAYIGASNMSMLDDTPKKPEFGPDGTAIIDGLSQTHALQLAKIAQICNSSLEWEQHPNSSFFAPVSPFEALRTGLAQWNSLRLSKGE